MAITEFSIDGLYQQAFGYQRGKPYDQGQVYENAIREGEFPDTIPADDQEGTEFVNMRNTLRATLPTGQLVFMPMMIGGVLLPNEPSVTIVGQKTIVETALAGSTRRGTVKELISVDDYQVTIRGIALNYASKLVYPEDEVKAIRDLYEKNQSLVVESALTNLFGIYRLVIKSASFPEMVGIQHAQAYELVCVSDEDFELEIL